ncbi:DEAD/DEAH box helicase family protein [Desulforapulum autotrophicum]|nr:DEAD/DEAH box helicase family protein [Desulforapulum autotrophicum]
MKSTNFEVLRDIWPELASLGGFAENYSYTDPSSALVKLRTFVESLVDRIYRFYELPRPYQPSLNDLLNNHVFKAAVPPVILNTLHIIRKSGNKAAHGADISQNEALKLVKDAHHLSRWFYVFTGGAQEDWNDFQEPGKPETISVKNKKRDFEELAVKEAQLQAVLEELKVSTAKIEAAEKKAGELEKLKAAGQKAADSLEFDEEMTRQRLIDCQLVDAGWDVAPEGKDTEEVTQEEEVQGQPTKTGVGYADYVLWDNNGKPLAIIEAKKTSVSAEKGRKQAQLYADGLEKTYGQRPVIFYTNGFEIFIWDDAQNYPPRQLFGFYSKDSLQYLIFQRKYQKDLASLDSSAEIAGRLYQLEAIKRVSERFSEKHRKALIVQATGTGKTRVSIALTDLLIRAGWVKRVLFLCDRKELRRQAKNAFNDFISEPMTIVSARTAKDRNKRIYLGTYPAVSKIFQTFDTGFFDLIIADESHRSIYNRYRDIFTYFDALQVGLTATPVDYISRNTFKLFGCSEQNPTAYYSLGKGVEEGYLAPYEVYTHTTKFLRSGIKYKDLTDEQRQQLEDDGEDPKAFNFDAAQVDKQVFNKETNRMILRNLMENGIREETGQFPGKTIVFARSHDHAVLLAELFDEIYPQYGGKFCQVIDNYDPRAEQLIDDFKEGTRQKDDLTIAISVDMLDTGIDIPQIVNLVFAKPVKSKVKFWQMIGRGTRLSPDLFGPGKDKTVFRIFDHWGNFEYFEEKFKKSEPKASKSLMQQVFETRVSLADKALKESEIAFFDDMIHLIQKDIFSLPEKTIAVREKWREKKKLENMDTLKGFSPATFASLKKDIAPLMQWVDIRGHADACRFDQLIGQLQIEKLKQSALFDNLKGELLNRIGQLRMNLNQVKEKAEVIKRVKDKAFWDTITLEELEEIRIDLRDIMQFRDKGPVQPNPEPYLIDIEDSDEIMEEKTPYVAEVEMAAYKKRVEEALLGIFDKNNTLQKIKTGQSVSKKDLDSLVSLVLTQNPDVDFNLLAEFYPENARSLDFIIRSIIGMDAGAVQQRFEAFAVKNSGLSARQVSFLRMLQNHIAKYGSIEIDNLYEAPFTTLASDGIDGVFKDGSQVDDIISILETFQPHVQDVLTDENRPN